MGETRLAAWGFQVGIDYPIVEDHYISVSEHGPLGLLAFLHYCETGSGEWKSGLMRDFAQEGDATSVQDFDYDWAEESIHLMYGNKWLPYKFDGDHEKVADYVEEMGNIGFGFYAKTEKWNYEPFLIRIQEKLAKMGESS